MDSALVVLIETLAKKRCQLFFSRCNFNINNEENFNKLDILDNQVGGLSHKRFRKLNHSSSGPLGFVCKPLHFDHRGLREVAFYECVQLALQHSLLVQEVPSLCNGVVACRNVLHYTRIRIAGPNPFGRTLTKSQEGPCESTKKTYSKILHEVKLLRQLSSFLPAYRGLHTTMASTVGSTQMQETSSYLILEDVTHGYKEPCILDLKLGTTTYEHGTLLSKQNREIQKYPYQKTLGVRIVGMRIVGDSSNSSKKSSSSRHNIPIIDKRTSIKRSINNDEVITVYDKYFGFSITNQKDLSVAVSKMFLGGCKIKRIERAKIFLTLLTQLKEWFISNDVFVFVSSSILLVYEGSRTSSFVAGGSERYEKRPSLRMIDLAHVRTSSTPDSSGYLVGLRTIEEILKQEVTCSDDSDGDT